MTVRVCPICDIADCATHRSSTPPAIDPAAIREAALQDRIEQLERGMDALQDRLDTANKARADANFRANKKQFKLAKAVEALQDMVVVAEKEGWDKAITGRQMIIKAARAVLAELEGTK